MRPSSVTCMVCGSSFKGLFQGLQLLSSSMAGGSCSIMGITFANQFSGGSAAAAPLAAALLAPITALLGDAAHVTLWHHLLPYVSSELW